MSPAVRPLRVGMFGGAFDPPHRAHLALARAAIAQLQLDRLHVVPTGQAWHKSRPLSEARHRLAMSELIFKSLQQVVIDAREIERDSASYSVDSLREIAQLYPDSKRFLIVGLDQLRSFRSWSRYQDILATTTLVVAQRASELQADDAVEHKTLGFDVDAISSTALRQQLADPEQRKSALQGIQTDLARYIEHHHLFESEKTS